MQSEHVEFVEVLLMDQGGELGLFLVVEEGVLDDGILDSADWRLFLIFILVKRRSVMLSSS